MPEETELIGGPEKRAIRIVAHDPAWPTRFAAERARIVQALGATARRVYHIGSTAVPGLVAKPIIDIDLSVPDPGDEPSYLPALERAGYHLRVRQPGHRMVRSAALDVHVHVCGEGSDWERRHLLFRDWLRRDAADRAAYAALKRALAERDWADMNAYAEAKGGLIAEITVRAEEWAQAVGWSPRVG
ncbi:GrpB family protein [Pseudonocardia sichuanensis]